jgi:hypothetical protein
MFQILSVQMNCIQYVERSDTSYQTLCIVHSFLTQFLCYRLCIFPVPQGLKVYEWMASRMRSTDIHLYIPKVHVPGKIANSEILE